MPPLIQAALRAEQKTEKSLKKVEEALNEFLSSAQVGQRTAVLKFGADLFTSIARRTPVDTGRLRAGWSEAFARLGAGAPPMPPGTDPSSVREGKRRSRAFEKDTTDGYRFVAVNAVRYGPFIETGLVSPRAPRGMVRVSIDQHRRALVRAVKRIRTRGTK